MELFENNIYPRTVLVEMIMGTPFINMDGIWSLRG